MISFISDDQYNIEKEKECQILVKNGATFPGIAIGIGQTNPSKILSALILESIHDLIFRSASKLKYNKFASFLKPNYLKKHRSST